MIGCSVGPSLPGSSDRRDYGRQSLLIPACSVGVVGYRDVEALLSCEFIDFREGSWTARGGCPALLGHLSVLSLSPM